MQLQRFIASVVAVTAVRCWLYLGGAVGSRQRGERQSPDGGRSDSRAFWVDYSARRHHGRERVGI